MVARRMGCGFQKARLKERGGRGARSTSGSRRTRRTGRSMRTRGPRLAAFASNPAALGVYLRLGFIALETTEVNTLLEWREPR